MIKNTQRLAHRLGRRGAMLTLMGVTYVFLGIGVIIRPNSIQIPWNFLYLLPEWGQGSAWILSGLVACIFAWRQVPQEHASITRDWWEGDGAGWNALYVMPFLRFMSYVGAWVGYLITGVGSQTAWYTACLHLPFILVALICSGWRENAAVVLANQEELRNGGSDHG